MNPEDETIFREDMLERNIKLVRRIHDQIDLEQYLLEVIEAQEKLNVQ